MRNDDDLRDLQALEAAVNHDAGAVAALWLAFLTFASYLAVSVGSITGPDLLLERPLTLPLLDAQIPMLGFAVLAPVLLAVFHFHLLLQFQSLAQKTLQYRILLNRTVHYEAARHLLRQRLSNFALVQLLSAPKERHPLYKRIMLRSVVWITTIAAPVCIFILILLAYLPYHSEPLTWLHRGFVLTDLVLVVLFWPALWGHYSYLHLTLGSSLAVVILTFATVIPVFPGETLYPIVHTSITARLFEGDSDPLTKRPWSPFSNRIIAEDLVPSVTVSLRSRNLDYAILRGSDLRGADFRAASLVQADLSHTNLEQAEFDCVHPQPKCPADLRGTRFIGADLRQAELGNVIAVGASFFGADLRDANMKAAVLLATDLRNAWLWKAKLGAAILVGAALDQADLTRAELPLPPNLQYAVLYETIGINAHDIPEFSITALNVNNASVHRGFVEGLSDLLCSTKDDFRESILMVQGILRSGLSIYVPYQHLFTRINGCLLDLDLPAVDDQSIEWWLDLWVAQRTG